MGLAQDVQLLQEEMLEVEKSSIQLRAAVRLLAGWLARHTMKSQYSKELLIKLNDPDWDGT